MIRLAPLTLALALTACGSPPRTGPIAVSVVEPAPSPGAAFDAVVTSATASGLVAFDANGQIEPALAESWIVTPDGMSTIFRLRHASWPDGRAMTGADVAAGFDRARASPANRLRPLLTAVDDVVGMTGRVVEIRLSVARPNLLQLLAQPDMAITRDGRGIGAYTVAARTPDRVTLAPVAPDDDRPAADPVIVQRERAARAVARFAAGRGDLVLGGSLADLAVARAARLPQGRLRFDPVQGLFGLAIVGRTPFLADAENRAALAMAIDRDALPAIVGLPTWTTTDAVLPARLDSASEPIRPAWIATGLPERRALAASRVVRWRGEPPVLRVALPPGPGMRALFAVLASSWRAVGVSAVAVPVGAPADLRLIDAVAPNASANWYLTSLSCAAGLVCDASGDVALIASRAAPSLASRAARLAEADAVLTARASFIALGSPVRWSLVDRSLTGYRDNAFAVHPLHTLRPRGD